MSRTFRKIRWMIVGLFAPEFILCTAVVHLASSWNNNKEMAKWAENDRVQWTLSHSFFANMGGIAIKFPDNDLESQESNSDIQRLSHPRSETGNELSQLLAAEPQAAPLPDLEAGKMHDAYLENEQSEARSVIPKEPSNSNRKSTEPETSNDVQKWMSIRSQDREWGFSAFVNATYLEYSCQGKGPWRLSPKNRDAVEKSLQIVHPNDLSVGSNKNPMAWYNAVASLQGNVWILTAPQLHFARESGIISSLPDILDDDLDNQSNSDALVKMLAVLQTSWLVLQLITREHHGIASSQLEVLTLASTIYAFVTYIALWKKPQDITVTTVVEATRHPSPEEVVRLGGLGPTVQGAFTKVPYLPNNYLPRIIRHGREAKDIFIVLVAVGGAIFGAIHCVAWNFIFPNPAERILWRVSSILTLGTPIASLGIVLFIRILFKYKRKEWLGTNGLTVGEIRFWCASFPWVFYILARLFIIIEAFRTLCFLPPEAYYSTWVANAF